MNENEKNVTEVQEVRTEPQPEKELSAEEALAERERLVAERERQSNTGSGRNLRKKALLKKACPLNYPNLSPLTMMSSLKYRYKSYMRFSKKAGVGSLQTWRISQP